MINDFIPLGFGQFLFKEDLALDSLSPFAEEDNLLRTSQVHHIKNISIAPIYPQDDEEPSNHFVIHTQGRLNVPLLDILLPQEGAPLIIHLHEQPEPSSLPEVSQVIYPSIDFLLPIKNEIQHDVSPTPAGPQIINKDDGIPFHPHSTQFPKVEFTPREGPNLFNAIASPPINTLGGLTPSVRPQQRILLTDANQENLRDPDVHNIFMLHSFPLSKEGQNDTPSHHLEV